MEITAANKGCYNDRTKGRDLSYSLSTFTHSKGACIQVCSLSNYLYSGTQTGLAFKVKLVFFRVVNRNISEKFEPFFKNLPYRNFLG